MIYITSSRFITLNVIYMVMRLYIGMMTLNIIFSSAWISPHIFKIAYVTSALGCLRGIPKLSSSCFSQSYFLSFLNVWQLTQA